MSKSARAQNDAQQSAISNQETGTASLSQSPAHQDNTTTAKPTDKPLTMWAQVELVRKAMNQKHDRNFGEWGSKDLASLLDYQSDKGQSMDTYITFFRDLLLFLASPKVSQQFSQTVPNGIERIKALSGFFIDLLGHTGYDEFVAYHRMYDNYKEDDVVVFLSYAEDYLTGEDLRRVLAAHGRELESVLAPVEETKPASRPWYMTPVDENPFTLTNDELVAALDRYYPGKQWPADKKTIDTHEKMRFHLTYSEKERLSILNETPEQKQKRLIDAAVYSELNGPSIPEQIRSVREKVEAAVKAPKVLAPDTQIQFRLDKVQMQHLTMDSDEKKAGKSAPKKGTAAPSKKPAAKKPATKKRA